MFFKLQGIVLYSFYSRYKKLLIDRKCSKDNNIVKYYYNLKLLFLFEYSLQCNLKLNFQQSSESRDPSETISHYNYYLYQKYKKQLGDELISSFMQLCFLN